MSGLGAFILSIMLSVGPGSAGTPADDPFHAASLAPDDVSLYLHAQGAASIRARLAHRPIRSLFQRLLTSGDVSQAWHRLAVAAQLEDEALFDVWLGRDFTLLTRPEGEASDWILITEVDPDQAREILRRLRPRRLAPRHQLSISELPEHELLIASEGSTCLIGPTQPGRLFDEVLAARSGDPAPANTLAGHPAMARGRALGGGEVGLFSRHDLPLGGFSVMVADLEGEQILLHHAGRFENPPFQRPMTELEWDMAPLEAFEDKALLVLIEPTDIGGGPVEVFIEAVLDVPLLSAEMRRNLDNCRLLVVGEVEGRMEKDKTDLLLPAISIAVEIEDPQRAELELDEHVLQCMEATNRHLQTAAERTPDAQADALRDVPRIEIPSIHTFRRGEARRVDLGPVMERFGDRQPMLQSVSLNWSVATGPHGSYYVLASHPEQLGETIRALKSEGDGAARTGKWTSGGILNGRRIAAQLRSWSDQAELLAEAREQAVTEFRETLLLFSELAAGIEHCRWRIWRPTEKEMQLEAQIILARPESAGGE